MVVGRIQLNTKGVSGDRESEERCRQILDLTNRNLISRLLVLDKVAKQTEVPYYPEILAVNKAGT